MRILQLAALDSTIGTLLFALLRELRDAGREVAGAAGFNPGSRGACRVREAGFDMFRVRTTRSLSPKGLMQSLFSVVALLRRYRPDVLHVHTPVMAMVGRVAGRLCRVPCIVYTAHGFYHHDRMGKWKRLLFAGAEEFACRYLTDLLLLQSREDHDWARKRGIRSHRTGLRPVHIGNGVQLDEFNGNGECRMPKCESGIRYSEPDTAPLVLCVCRVVREKGVFDLIQASRLVIDRVPEVRFVLVGDGPALDGVKESARECGVESRWVFAGFRQDVRSLLARATLFVLPSWREGMPRSIIEAMAMGRPVVATNIRGCREEVIDGVTGLLVPPQDPAGLADAIVRIVSDETLAAGMGRAGRRRARVLYDERKVTRHQLHLIDAALACVPVPVPGGAAKRLLDVVGSVFAFAVFLPVLGVAALAVRLTMGRPVLFRQVRPGLQGRSFVLYKLRTMTAGPGSDDERLTRPGRLLRALSIDELPQLLNVLKGDMSLVGPRPLRMEYLSRYTPAQARRHEVRPGITGWAQVHGRNVTSWEERLAQDVWYVDHRSFRLDLKILLMTVVKVLFREGVSASGTATMPEFTGSGG